MKSPSHIKRGVLKDLYRFYHQESHHGSKKTGELFDASGTLDEADFYEALQYLHDNGYVEGTPVPFDRQGYLRSVKISQKGIDLLDDPEEFDRLFPLDGRHVSAEEFVQAVRQSINRSGLSRQEKDSLLEGLQEMAANQAMMAAFTDALRSLREA